MEKSDSDLSEQQLERLRDALLDMPMPILYSLADKYDVEITPEAFDIYSAVDSFLDELSPEAKSEILSQYGDAGSARAISGKEFRESTSVTSTAPMSFID